MDTNNKDNRPILPSRSDKTSDDFVLEKSIFSKVFEKDIRRVYIYKKAERLAKAVHVICPAFADHPALKDKVDAIAVGLINAAILPQASSRAALAKELLTLSSLLSIAKTGGILSVMNAEVVAHEVHLLLEETALYEEPKVVLDSHETFAAFAKKALGKSESNTTTSRTRSETYTQSSSGVSKGQVKDKDGRKAAILSFLRSRGPSFIKDITVVVRGVSEKTIQRELQALVFSGEVWREGERRWSRYSVKEKV
jgi:hypothetical protein